MLPATLLLGAHDIATKKLLAGATKEQFLLGVVWSSVGLLSTVTLLFFGVPNVQPVFWGAFIGTAALNVLGQLAWYRAFKHEPVSVVAPLRLLIPILVIGTGFLFLREQPSLSGILGIIVTMVGLWFLLDIRAGELKNSLTKTITSQGIRWGFVGVVSFAVSFPLDKVATVASSAPFFISLEFMTVGIVSIGLARLFGDATLMEQWRILYTRRAWLFADILILLGGSLLSVHSLNFAFAAYASSVKRLQSLWSVLFSGAFLKEGEIGKKLLATAVMLAGVAITVFFG